MVNLSCEREERLIFSGLNAQYDAGDVVHIAGPNGVGKTTLMRIVTGLSSHYEGEVRWCGEVARGYEFHSSLLYHGHHAGINPSLTPLENLHWYFGLNGVAAASARSSLDTVFLNALAKVGLTGYGDIPCLHMSAGQQRRVALARLYISEAPLWVLDEPFTAIDKAGVAQLEQRIDDHAKSGGLVLLTTHQASALGNLKTLNMAKFAGGEQ
ncbi:MAG: cytochrome c biogenesis heme-transporting ATPase CcmA [Cellvibrionaceae bacterium]|nr:cytochrome c biogenesis heme-transporting ATPase CcmA [Cellvibrionaceae bacterium]